MSSEVLGRSLTVVLIVKNVTITEWLREQLQGLGHTVGAVYHNLANFSQDSPKDMAAAPHLVITDQADSSDIQGICRVLGHRNIAVPIIIVSDQQEELLKLQKEARLFIFGRVFFPLSPQQFQAGILLAVPLFEGMKALEKELASTQEQLSNQKLIARAKDVLCEIEEITPQGAHKKLKHMATSREISMAEQARRIIAAWEELQPKKGKERSKHT